MKHITAIIFITLMFFAFSAPTFAGWNTCIGCHNGTLAPDKDKLKEKHKTVDNFVKAALATKNDMMKAIQKDEKAIREAGKEIGLQ